MTMQFEARLMGLKKTRNKDGDWCECRLEVHPNEAQELFMLALGTRLGVAVVEITDDEQPITPEKPRGGELAKRAGILCGDGRFKQWILQAGWFRQFMEEGPHPTDDREFCAAAIRWICGVKSRADLDHNAAAAQNFWLIEQVFKQAHGMMAEKR